MIRSLIVVDKLKEWNDYYPSEMVIDFEAYLALKTSDLREIKRVINLCNSRKYLGTGYYCSLLAEARKQKVIPSVNAINDLNSRQLYLMQVSEIGEIKLNAPTDNESNDLTFHLYFGETRIEGLKSLGRKLFERVNIPLLQVTLVYSGGRWIFNKMRAVEIASLEGEEQNEFASALEVFSQELWRKPQLAKSFRWELALLLNPSEKFPPSNKGAIQRFIKAGNKLKINTEVIEKHQRNRIGEFDALFIRETTEINHHTYRISRRAEMEGLVVIDDSQSILRCCNKVFLTDAFERQDVPMLKSKIVSQTSNDVIGSIERAFDYPYIIKVPNGSFSRGVIKVENSNQLNNTLKHLFQESSLLLVQEYFYTEYDWRIGILNNKPLYANRYYMAKNHWQIYNHGKEKTQSGKFDSMPTFEVPKCVIEAATKASRVIGNGLYGVDIKQQGNKAYVIEVNDNPSIEYGVEDKYLGDELYHLIMSEFLRRMELRGK